jgi:hypothetical protein
VLSGNPVFPVRVRVLGITVFDAPRDALLQTYGSNLSSYVAAPGVVRHAILPAFRREFAAAGLMLFVGALVVVPVGWRSRRTHLALLTAALTSIGLFLLYTVTPFTALGRRGEPLIDPNARYAGPALVVAGAVAAALVGRLDRRVRIAFELAGAVAVFDAIVQAGELLRFPIDDALTWRTTAIVTTVAVAVAVAVGVAVLAVVVRARLAPRLGVAVAIALTLVATSAGATVVWRQQRVFADQRYRQVDPVWDWVIDHAPAGVRIALAGAWHQATWQQIAPPSYPLFGPRLRNEVEYVGPVVRDRLHEYRSEPEFLTALQRGDFDLLVVGIDDTSTSDDDVVDWARRAGLEQLAASNRLALFRV